MAVTESWGREELSDSLISPPGYHLFRQDRLERQGGGVFILVKHDLKPVEYSFDHDGNIPFEDSVWCAVKVSFNISLLIGCIYRSPMSSLANNAAMSSLFGNACSSFDGLKLVLGDFNCPDIDWELQSSQPAYQFLLDCCNDNFLHQMVSAPTRGHNILDLVFVDDISFVSETLIDDPFPGSDHNSVFVNLTFDKSMTVREEQDSNKPLDFARADWDSYRAELFRTKEDELFVSSNVDTTWEAIKQSIWAAATRSIPVKKKLKFLNGTPLTGDVLRAFRARKKTFQQTRSSSSPLALDLRERAEQRLSQAICNSRIAHEKKIATACKSDARCFWKYVRASLANKPRVSRVFMPSGSLTETDFDTANCFNNFFASVLTNDDSDAPDIPLRSNKVLNNLEVKVDDVYKVVRDLPLRSSPGPDGITYLMIKEGGFKLTAIFARFYNFLLSRGDIPTEWKRAHVIPIHKKGSLAKCENYRPVSLTSVVCKVMEAIIKKVVLNFFLENGMLSVTQHGFLPKRSSSTALLDFLEDVSLSIDNGLSVDAVYLDFRKAFDSVPHKRLIKKLVSYGIREPLICWISSFLTNRVQMVKIGNTLSHSVSVVSGVPQGSVLGPLLFLIYINDIDDYIQNASIIKFADDIRLYMAYPNHISHVSGPELLQDDLSRVLAWSKTWLLKLSSNKCNCIHFGSKNSCHNYFLDSVLLPSTKEEVDLGVLITSDLKPSSQCRRVAARANKILGCIRLAFKYLDPPTLVSLYKALVLPHLDYCSVAWCPFYIRDIEVLEKVQRRMTRILPHFRDLPYEQRLKSLNLLTLYARRLKHDLIFVFKLFNNKVDLDASKFFAPTSVTRTRGHNLKLQVGFSHHIMRKNFFSQRVIKHWNNLPSDCVNATSLSSFELALSGYFIRNDIH